MWCKFWRRKHKHHHHHRHHHSEVVAFQIKQIFIRGESMAIKGILPGQSGSFALQDIPLNSVLPAGVIPVWTSSDTTNAPVVASADGLSASVALSASAVPGGSFNLQVDATLPDGTTPSSGPVAIPILAPPPPEPSSFVINQVS